MTWKRFLLELAQGTQLGAFGSSGTFQGNATDGPAFGRVLLCRQREHRAQGLCGGQRFASLGSSGEKNQEDKNESSANCGPHGRRS
jgi:hypothetical protein